MSSTPGKPTPRWVIWAALATFFGVLAVGTVIAFLSIIGAQQAERDQQSTIQTLSKNNDALRSQLQRLGQNPVAPPAATVVNGLNGRDGLNGKDGKDGRGVVSFTCESDGTWLVLYTDASTETLAGPCVGATGATGAAGANGADSTVPGPPGATGATGAAGQPPTSWTYPLTYIDLTGRHTRTYTCTRTAQFDPANPTYTCTAN